jgi:hypothetical protein
MGVKAAWLRPIPIFILGLYLGGHISVVRPLFHTLQELETTSGKLVQELEEKTRNLNLKLQQCRQGSAAALNEPTTTTKTTETDNVDTTTATTTTADANSNPFCQLLATPWGTPSAGSLWMHSIDRIHTASRLPEDIDYSVADFTAQLLDLISPRLPLSVKSPVRDYHSVDIILRKAWARHAYLQRAKSESSSSTWSLEPPPPPVRILVMGGSVTKGVSCYADIKGVNRFQCAWPNRLEQMINQLAGGELVQVKVVGMGGTNSATGAIILEYDLIPADAKNPDVIVNSYATNDMHVITMRQAQEGNTTLRDQVFDMTQDYVRQALRPLTCQDGGDSRQRHQPLLLHLDDYLGNEQREIWSTTALAQGVHVLASYYGFASVSYSDMVRDWVYGDTRETLFSADWYKEGDFGREIHPGVGAHTTMAWAVAYNFLNLATTHCGMVAATSSGNRDVKQLERRLPDSNDLTGRPQSMPQSLPPRLTKVMCLEDISEVWQRSAALEKMKATLGCQDRCPFSWVGGIDLLQSDENWVRDYFNAFTMNSNTSGWKLHAGNQKMGFIPISGRHGAEMTLTFSNLTQSIQSLTFFTMKSYGDKWKDSRAEVKLWKRNRLQRSWDEVASRELVGSHDKIASETYIDVIKLPKEVSAGDSIRMTIKFLQGQKFKLMGLAVCS